MILKPPWRGHIFFDVDIANVGWCCLLNFLILRHDHIHNLWHNLWCHNKTKSQLSKAISPPSYHNSLKGSEWSVDLDLDVGSSQIKRGNVAPLLSPFLQFLGTNDRVGCIHIYKVIQFSVVHDRSLILLHYCHQRNQSLRQPQLLLRVRHKPAVHYPELQFIFVSTPDMLWNRVLCYYIFQWRKCSATCPLPRCSPYAPALVESSAEVRSIYCNEGSVRHVLSCKAHFTWAAYMDSSQLRNHIDS